MSHRIFNSIGLPVIAMREFLGWRVSPDGTPMPGFRYTGGKLDPPQVRSMAFTKDSVTHTYTLSGATNEWTRHMYLSGSFVFPHVSWRCAQILMRAFALEQYGNERVEILPEDPVLALKIYSLDDPIWIPIVLGKDLQFPGVGDKILVGHKAEINWSSAQPIDEITKSIIVTMDGDDVRRVDVEAAIPGLEVKDVLYASIDESLTTW